MFLHSHMAKREGAIVTIQPTVTSSECQDLNDATPSISHRFHPGISFFSSQHQRFIKSMFNFL